MKFRVILTTLVILPFLLVETHAVTKSAEDVVRETIEQVTEKLVTEKAALELTPGRIYDLIEELVVPNFDFPIISRRVLGKTKWRQIDAMQREAFIHEFTILLVRTYARALQEYSDEEFTFLPTNSDPDSKLVEVKTEVSAKGSSRKTPINFVMYIRGGQWKVVDFAIDGISMVNALRGEYRAIIRRNGFDGLLAMMRERNAPSSQ